VVHLLLQPFGLPPACIAALLHSLSGLPENILPSLLPSPSDREALRLSLPFFASLGLALPPAFARLLHSRPAAAAPRPAIAVAQHDDMEVVSAAPHDDGGDLRPAEAAALVGVALSTTTTTTTAGSEDLSAPVRRAVEAGPASAFALLQRHPTALVSVGPSGFVVAAAAPGLAQKTRALLAALFSSSASGGAPAAVDAARAFVEQLLVSLSSVAPVEGAISAALAAQARFYAALLSPAASPSPVRGTACPPPKAGSHARSMPHTHCRPPPTSTS
jgi:hypothetical protein